MSRRVRPRVGRICAATSAAAVTVLTLCAASGVVGSQASAAPAGSAPADSVTLVDAAGSSSSPEAPDSPSRPASEETAGSASKHTSVAPALPAASGTGRRIVFAIGAQRVWLVDAGGRVVRTYPVSGSVYDNLHPGSYEVYSRSRYATGIDGSGDMQYFVRFAHGEQAAIGFHSIPTQDGHPVQTRAQLGTPLSHGCVRQAPRDARRLWHFAPVGTRVVVTA